jgi:hypothetical protein
LASLPQMREPTDRKLQLSQSPSAARSRSLVVATRLIVRSGRLRFNSAMAAGRMPGVVAMIAPTDRNP